MNERQCFFGRFYTQVACLWHCALLIYRLLANSLLLISSTYGNKLGYLNLRLSDMAIQKKSESLTLQSSSTEFQKMMSVNG